MTLIWSAGALWWAVVAMWHMAWALASIVVIAPVESLVVVAISPWWHRSHTVVVMATTEYIMEYLARLNDDNNPILSWSSVRNSIISHCTTHCHHR